MHPGFIGSGSSSSFGYELYSKLLKVELYRDYIGAAIRLIKGNTRGFDYSSFGF